MPAATIRRCGPADAAMLADLGRRTFREAYEEQTDPAELEKHLLTAFSEEQLRAEVSTPGSSFHVATISGSPAGFIKLNVGAAQTEQPNENGLEIESLYVLREHQGTGAGGALLDRALELAAQGAASYVWLGVWELNERGRAFWTRMGFDEYGSHPFAFAGGTHTDVLMRRAVGPTP